MAGNRGQQRSTEVLWWCREAENSYGRVPGPSAAWQPWKVSPGCKVFRCDKQLPVWTSGASYLHRCTGLAGFWLTRLCLIDHHFWCAGKIHRIPPSCVECVASNVFPHILQNYVIGKKKKKTHLFCPSDINPLTVKLSANELYLIF